MKKENLMTFGMKSKLRLPWSRKEELTLAYKYRFTKPSELLKDLPGRTLPAIYWYAWKLGFSNIRAEEWSDLEDRMLKALYNVIDTMDLVEILGRSKRAIQTRAGVIGLGKRRKKQKKLKIK